MIEILNSTMKKLNKITPHSSMVSLPRMRMPYEQR